MTFVVGVKATIAITAQRASVGVDPIVLSKKAGDEVDWYNPEAFDVTLLFGTSPFKEHEFLVPAKGHKSSGPVLPTANICDVPTCPSPLAQGHSGNIKHGHYKYSILRDTTVLADPEVVIKP